MLVFYYINLSFLVTLITARQSGITVGQEMLRRERIQLRALHFVYNDNVSSYKDLLAKANLPKLELGRLRKTAIQVYKSC